MKKEIQNKMNKYKQGDLRVWWIPQVPSSNPFHVDVKNIDEAKLILNTLAVYDLYQLEHRIKPDYSNVGGLEVYDEDPDDSTKLMWQEWLDDNGEDIDEIMRGEEFIDEED